MSVSSPTPEPGLRRVLSLWDLIVYGIVLVQPIAAVPLFGLIQQLSGGYGVDTLIFGMAAMTLTAISYGRMASLYPSAGSAYTFVRLSLNERLGFLTGWAMFLDYLLVPLICTIYGALTLAKLFPAIPHVVWVIAFSGAVTLTNLREIKFTAKTNLVLMLVMMAVILAFIVLAIKMLLVQSGWQGLVSATPFYDATTFHFPAIVAATSVAALTYGGFDGVTTLAEEVRNPRRNVMLAALIVVLFTGIFGALQIYLAQLVWPDYHSFHDLDTAFLDVSRKVGGAWLFDAMAAILVVGSAGSALTAQAGVARLLFSMARAGSLPAKLFGHINPKTAIPSYNVIAVGLVTCAGAFVLNYESSAELINFGAFLAFMGVNAAVVRQWFKKSGQWSIFSGVILPACGFLFCLLIWVNLSLMAKVVGAGWFVLGVVFQYVQRNANRSSEITFET